MRSLFVTLFLLVTVLACAQTGTIVGTVTDSSGAVVPNVAITVTAAGTGLARQTTTNQDGNYVVPSLQAGEYNVAAEITGFKKKTITGIILHVNQEPRVDIVLEVGTVSEAVNVSGQAVTMQTENAVVGQVVDNRYTTQIPLNGRDFSQLLLLVPGTTTRPGGYAQSIGSATGSLGSGVSIGGRDAQNNFTMDGASNNAHQFGNIAIKPSVDAIQEFKVQTNSYTAEMGGAAFGQVSLITRSGTNAFHGALFEFWRNNVFDARNTFLPTVSRLNRNQFGGSVGGPVWKDHTFFFFNYEANTERHGVESTRSVPIDAWRNGDFSALLSQATPLYLKDPSLNLPCTAANQSGCFPGNKIPSARFNSVAKVAMSLWPKQNFGNPLTTTTNNLLVTAPDRFTDGQYTVKGDTRVTSKDTLSGRYSHSAHDETTTPILPTFEQIIPPRNQVALINWTHIFNPRLLGEFRTSFTRSEFVQSSPNTGKAGYYDQFGINNTIPGAQYEGAPTIGFTGLTLTSYGDSDFNVQRDISNEFNYSGAITWTHSNHTIKSGFTLTRYQQNTPGPVTGARRGNFSFSGNFTGQPFADFLLGDPLSATRVVGKGVETGRSWWHGYYAQDDWKVSRKLTINIGIRYEYNSPLADNLDRRSTFWPLTNDYGTGKTAMIVVPNASYCSTTPRPCGGAGDVLGLSGASARGPYRADRNNFAPRFGFAYSWNPKTVIRGGYGIFYTNAMLFVNDFVINRRQPPAAETQTATSSTATPQLTFANPFGSAAAAAVIATQNINPNFKEGYTQQWNLTIQREMPFNFNLEVGYVANKGTNLEELVFYNVPTPGPTATVQARRPFPTWSTALSMDPYVTSSYNSLQVKAVRRGKKGMTNMIAYTWSKAIDLSSERGNGDRGGGFSGSGDERNRAGSSRGLSGFDTRHRLVTSSVFEFPVGTGKKFLKNAGPVLNKFVGGWSANTITTYQSGFPTTAAMSADINGDGVVDRPDLIGPVSYHTRQPLCYIVDRRNPACGTSASAFTDLVVGGTRFGSEGRDTIIGPGIANSDVGVAKNTRFGRDERFNIQFRWEVFNFWNRANYNQPVVTTNLAPSAVLGSTPPGNPQFGKIISAQSGRVMQVGLKLEF